MAGKKNSVNKLNNTLLFIIKLLNDNNIKNWFIGYGTLLGIIRENSCINNDDDIDIICDRKNYNQVKKLLIDNNFLIEYGYGIRNNTNILKTKDRQEYCSIDFYMANVDINGNFNDTWERVVWSNCYLDNKLIEYEWKDNILYIPNNYENKLKNRYGIRWKIPQNSKGPVPRKRVI